MSSRFVLSAPASDDLDEILTYVLRPRAGAWGSDYPATFGRGADGSCRFRSTL